LRYLLDTDICIELIRHKPPRLIAKLAEASAREVAISSIGLAELELGVHRSKEPERARLALDQFLSPFTIVAFDYEAARVYGRLHAGHLASGQPIGPFDTLIAAHALSLGLVMVTNNEREYRRVPGLVIENWLA
jgi:tRNA(fMet)-specific endonuclease VapC